MASAAWSWQARETVRTLDCAWYRPPVLTDRDIDALSKRAKEGLVANVELYEENCRD